MHLVNLDSVEWTCRAAATKEEAMSLIEGGFHYVPDIDGLKLFKKRKQFLLFHFWLRVATVFIPKRDIIVYADCTHPGNGL